MVVDGSDIDYKDRLVSKLVFQFHGVEYTDTFSPVAKMDSIRLILDIAESRWWEVHHMDVKSDFIHGEIHEKIYMKHPECFIHYTSLFWRLNKSLYGLKQSPRAWYAKMDNFLFSLGYGRCKSDPNVYLQHVGELL